MKLSCTQENLLSGLALVYPIATRTGTLPILQNLLLEAKEGELKIRGTNLEIGATARVRGKIIEEGNFTVNGRLFYDYVSLLPPESKVDLELAGEHLLAHVAGQETKIHGQSAEEFPVIPEIDIGASFTLETGAAREAMRQVLFAIAPSETRPEIAGAFLKFAASQLTMVGTDSFRLSERQIKLKSEAAAPASVIAPLRTMQEVSRILSQAEGDLSITVSENQILFALDEVELISRLIAGNFPDYAQIIPTASKSTVMVAREPLARAVKSAALFCRSGLNHVSLQFTRDKVLVSARTSERGENMVEVPAKSEGADTDIVFDYRFLLDGLNAMAGDEVAIKLNGGASPAVFTPKEAGFLYLVMPIKQ